MNKKLIIIFAINIFLFLFFPKDTLAICSSSSWFMSLCKQDQGAPKDKCCRDSSCSGTGCGATGTIYKWEFCKAYECCATDKGGGYYTDFSYSYKYTKCSTADTCYQTEYLYPGLCLDSGCAVGGIYKACCSKKEDGSVCPNNCTEGNTGGVYGSIAMHLTPM